MPEADPVSNYPDSHQWLWYVNASYIITVIWDDTTRVNAAILWFAPEDVRTHSLRSGGARIMQISAVPDGTVMIIGRWCSLLFIVYIQQHISSFSAGISVCMSQQPWFWHLWASSRPPSPSKMQPTHSLTQDLPVGPSNTLLMTAQPKLHMIARAPHHHNFQPKFIPNYLDGVHSKFTGETTPAAPSSHPYTLPRKVLSNHSSNTPFTKLYQNHLLPHNQPTTHTLLPPSILTLSPPLIHLKHGL